MRETISDHIRSNVWGIAAMFVALSGTAYAVDGPLAGQNTVGTADIINGEVTNRDLATDSVASGKIVDRQVKNADLGLGASASNTIADGGVRSVDVQNDGLSGEDVKGLTGDDVKDDALTGEEIDEDTLIGGPTNPTGPAGGDLDGTYPNPLIAPNAVGSAEVAQDSLTGADVANTSSLGTFEIDEGSLGEVPKADDSDQLGGVTLLGLRSELRSFGASDSPPDDEDCEVENDTVCASVTRLVGGDVLVIAAGKWFNTTNAALDHISCDLFRDSTNLGVNIDPQSGPLRAEALALTTVDAAVPAGVHEYKLVCDEVSGEVDLNDAMLSVVRLG